MSDPTRAGDPGDPGGRDDPALIWLVGGIILMIVIMTVLAVMVWRAGGETARSVAALGLSAPGAPRPTAAPMTPEAPTPEPTSPPVPAWRADAAWYFAGSDPEEGQTTTYVFLNPGDSAVPVTAMYLLDSGGSYEASFLLEARERYTLSSPVMSPGAVRFHAAAPVFVERSVSVGGEQTSIAGTLPSSVWYFSTTDTRLGSDDVLSLANFNDAPARVTVTLFADNGITQTLSYTVPAMGRLSANLTRSLAIFSSVRPGTPRGAVVRSDRPVVAQQLVRLEQGGLYALDGTAALSRTWYVAEANTRANYETVITVLNPGPAAARIQVTYMPEGRPQVAKSYAVPANAPLHVSVNVDMPDAAMGIAVESDQPVAVSRVTYLDGGQGAHATLGAPAAAGTWYLPDVNAAEPRITFVILLNPGTSPADVTVALLSEQGKPIERRLTLAVGGRLAMALDQSLPPAPLSAVVTAGRPIVAERVTYWLGMPGASAEAGIGR